MSNYLIELHSPGSGSVKPSARFNVETTEEVMALVMLWSGNGMAVRVIETEEPQIIQLPDAEPGVAYYNENIK